MAETTVASVTADITSSFDTYIAELKQAQAVWEAKPAAGEGETARSARQVAEHIAGAGSFFAAGIAGAVGVQPPAMQQFQLASASEAVTATEGSHGSLMAVVAQIKDTQLAQEIDHPRLGKQTVAGLLGIVSYHLKDHANQLKTLRGA
jgi:hypothetical protein